MSIEFRYTKMGPSTCNVNTSCPEDNCRFHREMTVGGVATERLRSCKETKLWTERDTFNCLWCLNFDYEC
jgi:hypothetical protein